MNEKRKLKRRLALLYIGSFIASIGPLAAFVGTNIERYIGGPRDAVKLSLGGILIVILLLVKVIGKLKMPRGVVGSAVVLVLAFLLEAIAKDIKMLSLMWFIGAFADLCFFDGAKKRTKEDIIICKTADKTAKQVVKAVQNYTGRL